MSDFELIFYLWIRGKKAVYNVFPLALHMCLFLHLQFAIMTF